MIKILDQNTASRKVLNDSQKVKFPYLFKTDGLKIRVRKGVFSPKHFHGWEIFNRNFPSVRGKVVLEIGTATGVTALYLAKKGARSVVGVDISIRAVNNAKENVILNNFKNVDIRKSDIFSAIKPEEAFDIIYWNMPFSGMPDNYRHRSTLERALFDPGYRILVRFLKETKDFLTPNGRLLIGTGIPADIEYLKQMAQKYNYKIRLIAKEDSIEINPMVFELYELKQC